MSPQLLTVHMFPVTSIILARPQLSVRRHFVRSTCLQILMRTTSPAVTKRKWGGIHKGRWGPSSNKHAGGRRGGGKRGDEEEFDGFLILVRNQTSAEREGAAAAAAARRASCQESDSVPRSAEKTSFSLWLHYWWIILLFRWLRLAEVKSDLFFDRPWQDDDYWIIHRVFLSPSRQMSSSIFHEPTMLQNLRLNSEDSARWCRVFFVFF